MNSLSRIIILTLVCGLAHVTILAQKPKAATAKTPEKAVTKNAEPILDLLKDFNFGNSSDDKIKAEEFYKKGQAFWKTFDIQETIESYTKALEFYPNYTDALRERGKVYFMIGRHKEAIPDLTTFLKIEPNNAEVLGYRGMSYAGITEELLDYEGDSKSIDDNGNKAIADFDQSLKIDPQNAHTYSNRGRLYLNFRFYKEAIADLEKAVSLDNKYSVAYNNLGLAKFYSGADSGLKEFNLAIDLLPSYAETYFNRGNYYRSIYVFDKAIADYNKAIELYSTNAKYYNARGMAYFAKRDGISAAKDFTNAIGQKRDYARAYLNRAVTYKKYPASASDENSPSVAGSIVAQVDKMKADLDSAIKYNPNLADAYLERGKFNLSWLPIAINGYSEKDLIKIRAAFADFDKAVKLDPSSAEAFEGRASCYEDLGKQDLALADYNKAIELDPELVTAYMGRMGIYCKMGKVELSIADEKKIKALGMATINTCNLGR